MKPAPRHFLAAFGLLLFLSPAISTASYKPFLKEGDRHFQNYKNTMALVNYEEAYRRGPQKFQPLFKLIRAINDVAEDARDSGADSTQVESLFRRSLRLAQRLYRDFPQKPESPFVLAVAYGNLALFMNAEERVKLASKVEALLKESIAIDPRYPYHHLGLGIFYKEIAGISWIERFFAEIFFGDIPRATYADAEEQLLKSLQKDSRFTFAHFHLAQTYEEWARYEKAFEHYQKVIDLPQRDHSDPFLKRKAYRRMGALTRRFPSKFKHLSHPKIRATPLKEPVSGLWSSRDRVSAN